MGFDGKMVMLAGQIKLIVVTKGKGMMVNFIVVHAFSPMDPYNGGRAIHAALKGVVPYRTRNSSGEGRSKCSSAMLGGRDQ